MPTHSEKRYLAYTPKQIFSLVSDIEKYPEFLPWCYDLKTNSRTENIIEADMIIGFKLIRERFTTRVKLAPHDLIKVEYINGPFKYLNNSWNFAPSGRHGCMVDFFVEFEFKSIFLGRVMGLIFSEAMSKMVNAFEVRAEELYKN